MIRRKTGAAALTGAVGLVAVGVLTAAPASAHGYVNAPQSRSYLCKTGANADCGGVQHEPQSLEYLKGFPAAGPADGQIASAGGQFGGKLDEQSPTRWTKSDVRPGPLLFDWTYTAPHATAKWHYYMTKQGWDQNAPITRSALQLIGEVQHDGSKASNNPDHVITIPADRSGYHVILAVWDVADTVNAFYNVIDVNVLGSGGDDVAPPTVPSAVVVASTTADSVTLTWQPSQDDRSDVTYTVYRDGRQVATTQGTRITDAVLQPGTAYTYRVTATDRAGNTSAMSAAVMARTAAAPAVDVTAPTAPVGLHSMGETEGSVDLMWGASTDAVGVVAYRVYRDGLLIGSTSATRLMDTGLAPGKTYRYTVRAVDAAGNVSVDSNVLTKSTKAAVTPAPAPSGTWDSRASYTAGAIVTYEGVTYQAVQSHTGVGDPNWIRALSLWAPVAPTPTPAPAPAPTPFPTPTPAPITAAASDPRAAYAAGAVVTHEGVTYRAVQSHTGVGDPGWILAPSLWQRVG